MFGALVFLVLSVFGKPVESGASLAETDVFRLIKEFKFKKFVGAVFVTVRGNHGFEEGALFVDAGVPVACVFEYHAFSRKFFGKDAFLRFANACAAQNGVVDVFEAVPDEVHSFIADNHEALYSPRDTELVKPLKRSFAFEDELRGASTQKQSILKKIGFKGI